MRWSGAGESGSAASYPTWDRSSCDRGSLESAAGDPPRIGGIEVAGNAASGAYVGERQPALDAGVDDGGAARRLVEMGEEEMGHPQRLEGAQGGADVLGLGGGGEHEVHLVGEGGLEYVVEALDALAVLDGDAGRVDQDAAPPLGHGKRRRKLLRREDEDVGHVEARGEGLERTVPTEAGAVGVDDGDAPAGDLLPRGHLGERGRLARSRRAHEGDAERPGDGRAGGNA